jgi:Tol biopolymer transport system component
LRRLARGETETIAKLYLTDRARQAGVDRLLAGLLAGDRPPPETTILQFRRATAASYEARVLLRWPADGERAPATQTLTLRLGYERGLWLADDLSLGDLSAPTPTPTRRPAARAPRPASQLSGRLAFQVSSGGEIYTIQADGTGLRRLTDGLDPAWAPDGRRLAFTRWRYPWGLYLIRPDGSGQERVVDGPQLKEVAWAPDGQHLAFTVNRGSSEPSEICFFGYCFTIPAFSLGQIWIADLENGDYLSLPLDDQAVHAPTWHPGGDRPGDDRIVYAGERGLTWIDLDTMETGHFPGGSVWDTSPTYSPDGGQIAFMGRIHNRWEVMIMNADGSGRRQLTHSDPDLKEPPSNVAPAWSPGGDQIAFLSNRDGPWRIYVMNADGSRQRPMFGGELDHLGFRYEWATERVISWTD